MKYIKRIIEQIKNFFYWGWKLKSNFDWDYVFILIMLKLKLTRMDNHLKEYGFSESSIDDNSETRKSIRICILLLSRLIERDEMFYAKASWDKFNKKWGKISTTNVKRDDGLIEVTFKRKNVNSTNEGQYNTEATELRELSDKLYKRDKRLLFNIIENYLEYWWD